MYRTFIYQVDSTCKGEEVLSKLNQVELIKCRADISDYDIFLDAVKRSKRSQGIQGIVIAKNTITSGMDRDTIREYFEWASSNDVDLFYGCNWMDRCDMYSIVESRQYGIIVRTHNPNGFHCLYVSLRTIKKILGEFEPTTSLGYYLHKNVNNGCLKAYTVTPTMIHFDILKARKCRADSLKTVECQDIPGIELPSSSKLGCNLTFMWLILILYLVLITIIVSELFRSIL